MAHTEEIIAAMRNRARALDELRAPHLPNEGSVAVLFAGPSGTGKTRAAEAIAADLDLPLHRVDLSQLVSKNIGETEKNLNRAFDAAELAGAILMLDEADALFGGRTSVQDSHDRHANLEVSYLLDRIEHFNGLVILASNLKSHIDSAFSRRLRLIVDFEE